MGCLQGINDPFHVGLMRLKKTRRRRSVPLARQGWAIPPGEPVGDGLDHDRIWPTRPVARDRKKIPSESWHDLIEQDDFGIVRIQALVAQPARELEGLVLGHLGVAEQLSQLDPGALSRGVG